MKKVNENSPHYAPTALHYSGFLVVQQPVALGLTTVMLRSYVYGI